MNYLTGLVLFAVFLLWLKYKRRTWTKLRMNMWVASELYRPKLRGYYKKHSIFLPKEGDLFIDYHLGIETKYRLYNTRTGNGIITSNIFLVESNVIVGRKNV